jgi:hypothetical protein
MVIEERNSIVVPLIEKVLLSCSPVGLFSKIPQQATPYGKLYTLSNRVPVNMLS